MDHNWIFYSEYSLYGVCNNGNSRPTSIWLCSRLFCRSFNLSMLSAPFFGVVNIFKIIYDCVLHQYFMEIRDLLEADLASDILNVLITSHVYTVFVVINLYVLLCN